MQISNNLSSLIPLEKKLEESTAKLAKLTKNEEDASKKEEKELKHKTSSDKQQHDGSESNSKEETLEQTQIPLAYSVNANVVSVQKSTQKTVLDITV